MQKVVIFHPALAPYRIDLFNSLADKCNLLVVFLRRNVSEQQFDQALLERQLRCKFRYLTTGFDIGHHLFRYGVGKIIREINPDVVITSEFNVQTIQLALSRKCFRSRFKLLTLTDDSPALAAADGWKKRFLKPWILKMLNGVLLCSEEVRLLYATEFSLPVERMEICPVLQDAGVLRQRIEEGRVAATRFIREFDLSDKRIVLFVGRLVQVKNLPFLLRVFAAVADENDRLILVGDGPLRHELEVLTRQLGCEGKVIFPGRYDGEELYAWYLLGGILVLPSISEAFGAVVNEALAGGVPCLVSTVAGAKVLLSGPESGEVLPPDDDCAWNSALSAQLRKVVPLREDKIALRPCLQQMRMDVITDNLASFMARLSSAD